MNRDPLTDVKRILRKEVGFGCPVEGCGNPYLTWHHFDPTWSEKQHHDPKGMIALCREHHDKADAGAYTREQLHELKKNPRTKDVVGKFDWMRNKLMLVAGSCYMLNPDWTDGQIFSLL